MKFKKNSWHYWFYRLTYGGGPTGNKTNLCAYFWRTVLGISMIAFVAAFLLLILTLIGILFYEHTLTMFTILGLISVAVGCAIIRYRIVDRRYAAGYYDKPRELGLIRAYLKAKKDKICPIVELED